MTIYTIRHHERSEQSSLFDEPLTAKGKQMAMLETYRMLLDRKIDIIFSSPFVRCIQTILPYIWLSNAIVRVENSLYEFDVNEQVIHEPQTLTDRECVISGVSNTRILKSIMSLEELQNENKDMFFERVSDFKKFVKEMYSTSEQNVLLCTHMSVVNALHERDLMTSVGFGEIEILK